MKTIFLALAVCCLTFSLQAQTATTNLTLNYADNDIWQANTSGASYSYLPWAINTRFPNSDNFNLKYAAVFFDTLQFVNANSRLTYYPRQATTLKLDSFSVVYNHQNYTGQPDSLHITVFKTSATVVTGYGTAAATFTTPPLWDTVIVTTFSLSPDPNTYTKTTFQPGISLPQGQAFGVRVDFAGDTANKFNLQGGYRDECAGACIAATPVSGNNTGYYLNLTENENNYSGYYTNNAASAIFFDCDQSGSYTPEGCENFYIQDASITAHFTATLQYGVTIASNSLAACPGTFINLSALAYGSAATPYTYAWSTNAGTLTATADPDVSLIMPGAGNAIVSITVTDANNATTSTSVTVVNKGITAIITGGNPITVNCGSSASLISQVGGITTGKYYVWSTGAAGSTQSVLNVTAPGVYTLTVTNSSGCSATASTAVQYPGGLSNNASFVLPTPPNCENVPLTFINTTPRISGWTSQWNFGDGQIAYTINGTNSFDNPGVYPISLRMDSGGCVFNSAYLNLTILSATNNLCLNTALSVSLGSNQLVCSDSRVILNPLPTHGTAPFTYNWSTTGSALSCSTCPNPTTIITQTSVYTVTVLDANNQSATATVTYTPASGSNNMQLNVTNAVINCANHSSNTVLTVTGGASPFQFDWGNSVTSSGSSPQTNNYIAGGIYVITVRDSNNCVESLLDTVEYQGIIINTLQTIQPNCDYQSTGKLKATAAGGTAPYSYTWSNGATADSITGVRAYNYIVTVTDATNCSASALFELSPLDGWGFSTFLHSTNTNCNNNNGSISTTVNGGTGPFSYGWSNNATTQNLTGLSTGTYQLTVTDNLGCTTQGSVTLPGHCVSIISGVVFADTNSNCLYNNTEWPVSGAYITATGNGINYYAISQPDGHYSVEVPGTGSFTLSAHTFNQNGSCGVLNLCGVPNQTVVITTPGDSLVNNNFAYNGFTGFDLGLFLRWSSGNPGFTKYYHIYPANYSQLAFNQQATITFAYDSNLIYQSSNPPATHNLSTHTLSWTIDSIHYQGYNFNNPYDVTFLVPANLSLGYLLQSDFSISPTITDCDTSNNNIHTSELVTGSYDPNEKEVEPAGRITEQDSVLTYTIHFQNTGTDSTHFIIVTDTLPDALDPATVQNIASSHPYSGFAVTGKGILTWTFNPLRLVDSTTNEAGSKGFVKFSIKKRPNQPIGSIISNKAHIYFDYNQPVVTNTISDTMSLPSYIFELRGNDGISVAAYPNPFSDKTSIQITGLTEKFNFELYDITGSLLKQLSGIESAKFDIKRDELAAGIYFYRVVTGRGKAANGKLVVQ